MIKYVDIVKMYKVWSFSTCKVLKQVKINCASSLIRLQRRKYGYQVVCFVGMKLDFRKISSLENVGVDLSLVEVTFQDTDFSRWK
jgi:hypothetical protein